VNRDLQNEMSMKFNNRRKVMALTLMSDARCTAVLREGITDAELCELLSHPRRWSYAVRDPHGSVVAWGRGKTRAECESVAVENAAAYAEERSWVGEVLRGDWRFQIWAPRPL
jgi:hypothetical protein